MNDHDPYPNQPSGYPGQPRPEGHPSQQPGQPPGNGSLPPQQPPKTNNKALPWILGGCGCLALVVFIAVVGIGGYFVFFHGDGSGGSGGGSTQTPQAQPKYTEVPLNPCTVISDSEIEKIVPDADKESDRAARARSCRWEVYNVDGVTADLYIEVGVGLGAGEEVQNAREIIKPNENSTHVRRLSGLGDLAYASQANSPFNPAVVAFSESNLYVEVNYSYKNNKTNEALPYDERHEVALTAARKVLHKLP